MLYTRKGDAGTTQLFDSTGTRLPKTAAVFEALGTLDELNTIIGMCKYWCARECADYSVAGETLPAHLTRVQHTLFTIQAEVARAEKTVPQEEVDFLETVTNTIEEEVGDISSFLLPGGTHASAWCDMARTVARRAERMLLVAIEAGEVSVSETTAQYINRLSSFLYAYVRISNHLQGAHEEPPAYRS